MSGEDKYFSTIIVTHIGFFSKFCENCKFCNKSRTQKNRQPQSSFQSIETPLILELFFATRMVPLFLIDVLLIIRLVDSNIS